MLRNHKRTIKKIVLSALLLLLPSAIFSASDIDKEHKSYFRNFVKLMDSGDPDEFHAIAAEYEDFLLRNHMMVEYYKIKTNEGFYDVNHKIMLRAMQTSLDLERTMLENGDTAYHYMITGLRGDIQKSLRSMEADSIYKQALREVGDSDPKFSMLTHLSLAQVNYLSNPQESVEWGRKALSEAERLNNIEYRSLSLGIMAYVFFMTGNHEEFEAVAQQYLQVKDDYAELVRTDQVGRQQLSTRYDIVIEVAELGFEGKFEEAIKLAESSHLNVDKQLVIYRLHSMEGTFEKDQSIKKLTWWLIGLTSAYIFVYIMGRRRLMKKIWKRNDELKVALEKADAANQMKTSFIRSMSHEIRTPLNAINGFTNILCDTSFQLGDEEKEDLRKRITSSSEAITVIINELLELAAGESTKLDPNELKPVSINSVCRRATMEADNHNENQLQLQFTTDLHDDFAIKSDEETILQILDKIINNALKFTNEGSVEVHASRRSDLVEISVTDTGIGIPEEMQAAVFDNFVKLDEFKDGVGLGLSISRRLAKSIDGDISIDRTYKTGSRFVVQLPITE